MNRNSKGRFRGKKTILNGKVSRKMLAGYSVVWLCKKHMNTNILTKGEMR